MTVPYLLGVFTSWIIFTKEGKKFGNKLYSQASSLLNDINKEKKNENEKTL